MTAHWRRRALPHHARGASLTRLVETRQRKVAGEDCFNHLRNIGHAILRENRLKSSNRSLRFGLPFTSPAFDDGMVFRLRGEQPFEQSLRQITVPTRIFIE